MLKFFRKRRASARKAADLADPLKIRSLLDDPRLRAVMGETALDDDVAATPLFAHDPVVTVGVTFGRRQLVDCAA